MGSVPLSFCFGTHPPRSLQCSWVSNNLEKDAPNLSQFLNPHENPSAASPLPAAPHVLLTEIVSPYLPDVLNLNPLSLL